MDLGEALGAVIARARSLVVALACTGWVSAAAQPTTGTGRVVGIVTSQATGEPLGYADATIPPLDVGTLASATGTFHLRDLPAGPTTIRVRRIGFRPAFAHVTIAAGREDTVRVALAPLALALTGFRVTSDACPRRGTGDTVTLALIEQIRMNAERSRLLIDEHPYVTSIERIVGDEQQEGAAIGRTTRRRIVRVDTLTGAARHEWRYSPGNLVSTNRDASVDDATGKMAVPQLTDLADDAFIDAHCFRYAGIVSLDGVRRVRIDFAPSKDVRQPDLRGSIYLDTASSQIVQTTMVLERPSPLKPATDTWTTTLTTRFHDVLPSLPVIRSLCSRTTGTSISPRGSYVVEGRAAVESQRLIEFAFTGGTDDDVPLTSLNARADEPACFSPRRG